MPGLGPPCRTLSAGASVRGHSSLPPWPPQWRSRCGAPRSGTSSSASRSRPSLRRMSSGGFACGSNGGRAAPAQLAGWRRLRPLPRRARRTARGLFRVRRRARIHRARPRRRSRDHALRRNDRGTAFRSSCRRCSTAAGVLRRHPHRHRSARPEHRNDITEANLRKRADAYMLGGIMAARFDIETARDCTSCAGPAEGESAVGTLFIKQSCEMNDAPNARKIILRVSFYRKPGQSGTNPQLPTQLTEGQFESSARLEIRQIN